MTTPIIDFVKKYADGGISRLHMPGHKGANILGFEKFDITEIGGADVLYSENGIIAESEQNAAKLFGTNRTLYSTEGSSLAIRAMVCLAVMYAKQRGVKPLIAAAANAHKTFFTACAFLNVQISRLLPDSADNTVSCKITPDFLDEYLSGVAEKPIAVYVTSPDYLGVLSDIKGLSQVCRKHNVLLMVDNAHGAYLRFLPHSLHPISLGADICCDSAHKTLTALTGGAYLHISESAPELFKQSAQKAMSYFASTSPSYLILQSLDFINKYLSDGYAERLSTFAGRVGKLKKRLKLKGFDEISEEPLKITIASKKYGYTGVSLAEVLERQGIVCEFADADFIVFMLTPENSDTDLERLDNALISLKKKDAIDIPPPKPIIGETVISLSEALLLPSEEISIDYAKGRIMGEISAVCPPAIPVVVCGEKITADAVKLFKYYGIEKVKVIIE